MRKTSVRPGMRFGRLVVIARGPSLKSADSRWACQCDCGGAAVCFSASLRRGDSASCGCLNRERVSAAVATHRMHGTPTYRSWVAMVNRCGDLSNARYGGRGIQVCDRWKHSFESFLEDMGVRPSCAHSIDRWPNNDGNYEPSNCRWATDVEQSNNKRSNRLITYNGRTQTIAMWAREIGVRSDTLRFRIVSGRSLSEALRPGKLSRRLATGATT